MTVFAEYHALDVVSQKNAQAIKRLADGLPCRGRIDLVRVDPAATARSSLGPAAYSEYERVFGPRILARWPQHMVLDGLDTLELLLDGGNLIIHPRCVRLKEAFQNYRRQHRGGQWIDFPADGHPEEDMIDALRGGVRDALPDGNGWRLPSAGPCGEVTYEGFRTEMETSGIEPPTSWLQTRRSEITANRSPEIT